MLSNTILAVRGFMHGLASKRSDIGKMTMVIFVLRASLHGIGHYGALDVASPQSGNIGGSPCLPHISEVSAEALRIDVALEYCFGSRRRSRLCLHLSRENDLRFICELVRSLHLKSTLRRTCQPGTPDWIRLAAVVSRLSEYQNKSTRHFMSYDS